jgi:hypothetical protein
MTQDSVNYEPPHTQDDSGAAEMPARKVSAPDVCPECTSVDRSVRGDVASILLGKSIKCRNEWHDQPAPNEPKPLLREASKPPGKTGVEFVDRLADQWGARQSAALRGDMTGIKNADMWLGIIAKEYWGEIIASLRKTHAPPPAEPVSATPRTDAAEQEHFPYIKIATLSRQLERELAEAKRNFAALYDKTQGTPCEQIRHMQEKDALDAELMQLNNEIIGMSKRAEAAESRAAELQAKLNAANQALASEVVLADQAWNAAIDAVNGLFTPDGYDISPAARAAILALKVPQ